MSAEPQKLKEYHKYHSPVVSNIWVEKSFEIKTA
jgi:hypothetical protein